MMRRAERPPRRQRAAFDLARDGCDHRDLEQFSGRERRQDGGKPCRQHRFARAGRSGHADDARAAGVGTSIGMPEVVGEGANGAVRGEYVTLDSVSLGNKRVERIDAIVLDSGNMTLLGQSFLSRFAKVEIEGDRMVLR